MDIRTFLQKGEAKIVLFACYASKLYTLVPNGVADHVCFKCETHGQYNMILDLFQKQGCEIHTTLISGRDISTIQMKDAFLTNWGEVTTLELADVRSDRPQRGTWDHIEVYFGDAYDAAVQTVRENGYHVIEKQRPHHTTHEIKLTGDIKFVFTRDVLIEKARQGL